MTTGNRLIVANAAVITALGERGLLSMLDDVCRRHHVTREEVAGRTRTRSVSFARQDLWSRLRKQLGFSYAEIGRLFARNHTTVLHGVRAWETQMLAVRHAA